MDIIYEELNRKKEYDFCSGRREIEVLYSDNDLNINEQLELCDYLLDKIIKMHNVNEICPKFHLKDDVLIGYRDILVKKIKLFLDENLLDKVWMGNFTDFLLFKSTEVWMVKLGIILGEFYEDDNKIKKVINVFSKSGEYIFYLDNIIKKVDNNNDYLFKLAKESSGSIRLFALTNINDYKDESLRFILEEGYKDELYEDIYIDFLFKKVNLINYLNNNIDEKKLDNLSYITASFLKENNITSTSINYDFIKEFLTLVKARGNSLYSLYCIYLIREAVIDSSKERLKSEIDKFLINKKWVYIFEDSVLKSKGDSEAVIDLADYYNYQLTFEDFLPYLERDKRDMAIYFYIVQDGSKKDKAEMIKFFYKSFNIKDYIGHPEDIDENKNCREDLIFALVINSSKNMPKEAKTISMLGLFGNKNEVRRESVRILRRYRDDIEDKEWEVIKERYEKEPNKNIKLLMEKLLFRDENNKKEFIEIKDKVVEEHIEDVYLVTSEVCGVSYRHRGLLEEEIERSRMLYLERDTENEYNDKAIKIVGKSGFVIGYVPKTYSIILNNMLIGNKYLYAKVEDYELDKDYIKINIYESYKDVVDAINNTLQMITETQNGGYIN